MRIHFQTHVSSNGLNIWLAGVFIVGAMCGSGVLAIPKAIVDSGYIGKIQKKY